MEHLLFTGAPAPIVLSCVCSDSWDGGEFLSYPQRQAWDASVWAWSEEGARLDAGARSFNELAAFLQAWLFFGLLETVLERKVAWGEFTRQIDKEDGRRLVITTTRLKGYLEDWRLHMVGLPDEEKLQREDIIYDALSEACLINRRLSRKLYFDDPHQDSDLLQETLLCQTLLDCAIRRVVIQVLPTVDWTCLEGPNDQLLLEKRMQTAGWCPFTIRSLRLHLQPDDMAFVFSLGILRARQDHAPCVKRYEEVGDHCVADQVDTLALPRHVAVDCDCPLLSPQMDEVFALLQAGLVPTIAISMPEDDSKQIEFLLSGERLDNGVREMCRYLAISHVWKDGLGNPDSNALPRCQVKHIGKLLLELEGSWLGEMATIAEYKKPGYRLTVNFWMDTFCIPVQPRLQELRNGCIGQMRKIYQSAAAVLVFDPDLQQLSSNSKPIEVVGRLLSCSWRTRLWTYQEGTLAWDLCIPAQGIVYNLREILQLIPEFPDNEDAILDKNKRDILEFPIARSVVAACRRAVRDPVASVSFQDDVDYVLQGMLRAIAHRTTSRDGDETICIATFMDIDPAPILAEQPQDRMVRLLQCLPIISKAILFSHGPRLEAPGFRWAPQTFLSPHGLHSEIHFPRTYAPDLSDQKTRVSMPSPYLHPEGLGLVTFFSGVKLDPLPSKPIPKHFIVMTSHEKGFVIDISEAGENLPWEEVCKETSAVWAVLFANEEKLFRFADALLVEWLGETVEGHTLCRWRYELSVQALDDSILEGTRNEILQQNRFSGNQIPFQWWVID